MGGSPSIVSSWFLILAEAICLSGDAGDDEDVDVSEAGDDEDVDVDDECPCPTMTVHVSWFDPHSTAPSRPFPQKGKAPKMRDEDGGEGEGELARGPPLQPHGRTSITPIIIAIGPIAISASWNYSRVSFFPFCLDRCLRRHVVDARGPGGILTAGMAFRQRVEQERVAGVARAEESYGKAK